MTVIQEILEDFYHCTGISIHYLNKNEAVEEALGDDCKGTCCLLERDIPLTEELKTLAYPDQIHYIVMPFRAPLSDGGWFVAGPFQSLCSCGSEIVFKPAHCTHYFEDLLSSLVERHTLSAPEFDPHVTKSIQYIHDHYQEAVSLEDVCNHLGLNKNYFCNLFKTSTGTTFLNYLNKVRIDKSRHLLAHTSSSIIDVAFSVGFNNHNYFSLTFKKIVGMTPTVYRKNHLQESQSA